ncbi:hypothetical protein ACFOYU_13160 [Microvirga sp. GCM10011540]|uniref:hypothetical protein n=1 Tax=Microvirga sp. GCM10011540 TaxID=3317338 RepID=UPI003622F481
MRYNEIAEWQHIFNIATLFIPRGHVAAFVAVCEQHSGRIIETRVLPRFGGYSVDVLTGSPDAAAALLGAWIERSRAITATVRSGKTVLDTLDDLIAAEGER